MPSHQKQEARQPPRIKRNVRSLVVAGALLLLSAWGVAQRVGLLGCGDAARDHAYRDTLQAHGLSVVWIIPYYEFNNPAVLQGCEVVVLAPLLHSFDMPVAAQYALEQWVLAGGGMVTIEWTLWKRANERTLAGLDALLPATATRSSMRREVNYLLQTADPVLGAGLGTSISLGTVNEARIQARPNATVFYRSDYPASGSAGVIGWQVGSGRVLSFSTAIGAAAPAELANPSVARLLANAVRWAAGDRCQPTQGDTNRDGCVDDADLLTVLFEFGNSGTRVADLNCDGIVDDADLLIVLFQFGSGC